MKEFEYIYESPLTEGYKKVRVKVPQHNKVFKQSFTKITFKSWLFNSWSYFDNGKEIIAEKVPSVIGKVFITVFAPIFTILYGVSELKHEYCRIYFPRKYGSFTSYECRGKERDILLGKE